MTNPDNNPKRAELRFVIVAFVAIALSLLLFQSIWLAYVLGLLVVAREASVETKTRIKDFAKSHSTGLQGEAEMSGAAGITFRWLLAYTAVFLFAVIPLVYAIHTKTDIELLSREAERYIGENVIEDGSERYCYMDSCR